MAYSLANYLAQPTGGAPSWSPEAHGAPSRLDTLAAQLAGRASAGRRGGRAPHWSTQLAEVLGTVGGLWGAHRADKRAEAERGEFEEASGAAAQDLASMFANPAGSPEIPKPPMAPARNMELESRAHPGGVGPGRPAQPAHQMDPATIAHFTRNPQQLQMQLGMRDLQRAAAQEAQGDRTGEQDAALLQALLPEGAPPMSYDMLKRLAATAEGGPMGAASSLSELFAEPDPGDPYTLSPGQERRGADNELLASVPLAPRAGASGFNLPPGSRRYDRQGNEIAFNPPAADPADDWRSQPVSGGSMRLSKLTDAGGLDPSDSIVVNTQGELAEARRAGYDSAAVPGSAGAKEKEPTVWDKDMGGRIGAVINATNELMQPDSRGNPMYIHLGGGVEGFLDQAAGVPFVGPAMNAILGAYNPDAQRALSAYAMIREMILRIDTGAAISPGDTASFLSSTQPRGGDTPKAIEDKINRMRDRASTNFQMLNPQTQQLLTDEIGRIEGGGQGIRAAAWEPGAAPRAVPPESEFGRGNIGSQIREEVGETGGGVGDTIRSVAQNIAEGAERAGNAGRAAVSATAEDAMAALQDLTVEKAQQLQAALDAGQHIVRAADGQLWPVVPEQLPLALAQGAVQVR